MHKYSVLLVLALLIVSCKSKLDSSASFEILCEMVANEAKPIALSEPMNQEDLDNHWGELERIANQWNLGLYRETDFPVTSLFSSELTKGKEVVVIYKEPRLVQYKQLKSDLSQLESIDAARRLGRLLGYTAQGINELLMKNTDFKTLESYGVEKQVTHLYYQDTEEANVFYKEVLGLDAIDSNTYAITPEAILQLHTFDSKHPSDEPKSTAIAFLTDQLPEWYDHIQEKKVPIKYTYKPRVGGPHDGFVAIDPGGYLLEFEEFKQHSENELFMAVLENSNRIETDIKSLNFYGSITWTYHNDLLKMQQFYENELGFRMVADQGWTKIYQTSPTAFVGLVDERRGMMDYADKKSIEIEWQTRNDGAVEYFSSTKYWNKEDEVLIGPEKYQYQLR